jgi:hypothetical protein
VSKASLAGYLPRIVDEEPDELLAAPPAVAIEGARGVGKTSTALQRAATVRRLDDPAERAIVQADPERILDGEPPVLLDGWQRVPETWDLVRRAVDEDRTPRRFLLTGSRAERAVRRNAATREGQLSEEQRAQLDVQMSGHSSSTDPSDGSHLAEKRAPSRAASAGAARNRVSSSITSVNGGASRSVRPRKARQRSAPTPSTNDADSGNGASLGIEVPRAENVC